MSAKKKAKPPRKPYTDDDLYANGGRDEASVLEPGAMVAGELLNRLYSGELPPKQLHRCVERNRRRLRRLVREFVDSLLDIRD